MQLEGACALLTGASGGIGRALALALARQGTRLVLSGRCTDRLRSLAAELPPASVIETVAGDLTVIETRYALTEAAVHHDCGILINACGINRFELTERLTDDDVETLLASNLTAPIQLTRGLLPHLKSRDRAMIVNVGSAYGTIGFPGYAVYCASKFGLRGFSEALGRELADTPVKVLHVAPRATRTAMNSGSASALNTALGYAEDPPERVADRIVAAIRSDARRVSIGWPERFFSRLNQILPGLLDRALSRQLGTIRQFVTQSHQEETPL